MGRITCPEHRPSSGHASRAAIGALSQDELVRKSLGSEYADYYIQVKTDEWESYLQQRKPMGTRSLS